MQGFTEYLGIWHCLSFFLKRFYLFILERWEGKEKEKERNIDVQEIHQLVDSCTPSTGDLALNPGMCPDQESNLQPFVCGTVPNPLSYTSQGSSDVALMLETI